MATETILLGNRAVGYINYQQEAFITHRDETLHRFNLWDGLGFNKNLIKRMNQKIKEVWVFYHKNNGNTILLKTTPQEILKKGIRWNNTADIKDRQLILPLASFKKE